MAPSPAAGKQGQPPRTPTKLGRRPQSSDASKLGQTASSAAGDSPKPSTPQTATQTPAQPPTDTSSAEQQVGAAGDGGAAEEAKDKAEQAKGQAEQAAEETKEEADAPEVKDSSQAASEIEEEGDDAQGKVSQTADQASSAQSTTEGEEAEPTPESEEAGEATKEQAEEQTEDEGEDGEDGEDAGEDVADDATEKAADTADDAEETAEGAADGADDAAGQPASGMLGNARSLASRASDLAGRAQRDPTSAAQDVPGDAQGAAGEAVEGAEETAGDVADQGGEAIDDAQDTAEGAVEGAPDTAEGVTDQAGEAVEEAEEAAGDVAEQGGEVVDDAQDTAEGAASDVGAVDDVEDTADGAAAGATDEAEGIPESAEDVQKTAEEAAEEAGEAAEDVKETIEGADGEVPENLEDAQKAAEDAAADAEGAADEAEEVADADKDPLQDVAILKGLEVSEDGFVLNPEGKKIGRLVEGDAEDLVGYTVGDNGEILDDDGDLVGIVELLPPDEREDFIDQDQEEIPGPAALEGLTANPAGEVFNEDGDVIAQLTEGNPADIQGKQFNEAGEILDDEGNVIAKAEILPEAADLVRQSEAAKDAAQEAQEGAEEAQEGAEAAVDDAQAAAEDAKDQVPEEEVPGLDALEGQQLNEAGEIVDDEGNVIGKVMEGDVQDMAGLTVNDQGEVVNAEGDVMGKVGTVDQFHALFDVRILEGLKVNKKGTVLNEDGDEIGKLKEGDVAKCAGKTVNDKGEVVDKDGKVLGKVDVTPGEAATEAMKELKDRLGETVEITPEVSVLEGLKVNKKGQVLNEDGEPIGELAEGYLEDCAGKMINERGEVVDKNGKVLGKAVPLPQVVDQDSPEAQEAAEAAAEEAGVSAEDAEGAALTAEGAAETAEGAAEEAQEAAEEEPESQLPPLSILDGLKCNKAGKLVDAAGAVVGELYEGDAKKISKLGLTSDDQGQFWDNKGHVIGKARTLPIADAGEEAPFAGLEGLIVVKGGLVQDENGNVVGQLTEGDPKKLVGRSVDEDGDIIDKNGSVVGHADRLVEGEEIPQVVDLSVLAGKPLNKQGNIIGDEGFPIGRLVEGRAKDLVGMSPDENGQIWNTKGQVIGRVELIPEDEREQKPEGIFGGLEGLRVAEGGKVVDVDDNVVGEIVEGDPKRLVGMKVDEDGDIIDKYGNVKGHAEPLPEEPEPEKADLSFMEGFTINKQGLVIGREGIPVARVVEGNVKEMVGRHLDKEGQIWNDAGKVMGRVELIPESEREAKPEGPFGGLEGLRVIKDGKVADAEGNVVGEIVEGDARRLLGMKVDEDGDIIDKFGNVKGHAEPLPEEPEPEKDDLSFMEGFAVNKQGLVIGHEGVPIARVVEGNVKEMAGRHLDKEGQIWNDAGKVIGRVELIPYNEREAKPEGPFGGLEGLHVVKEGKVADAEGNVVGEIVEGDAKRLVGMKVDEDGDIIDKFGNVKGHAEPLVEEEEAPLDLSILEGKVLNKQGYLVGDDKVPVGRLVEGPLEELIGRKSDGEGLIHNDVGKVVGRCELIPENQRVYRPEGPFSGLEGLRVVKDGKVVDAEGNLVGEIVEGDPKKLIGHTVDADGDIIDKYGNTIGRAVPYEEEEEQPEDLSVLAGCIVNKQGKIVNGSGQILGLIAEGDVQACIGKKVDGKGQIWDDAGNVIGQAKLAHGVDSAPEGPFAGFEGVTVAKDGTIVTPNGDIVGRVVEGDLRKLVGHRVDADGDIIDKNGNSIGKAERWDPPEKERRVNPMSGKRVNRDGEVRDDDGNLMGKLTMGDVGHCAGCEIDDNGNVVDNDGNKIGEVTLLENIPQDELSEEELELLRRRQEDAELAGKMAAICQQTLERVQPVCKQITDHIERADRTPREELDEEELVNQVAPLIEEAGRILQECNGSLRGLDPDGRIAAQAKGRAGTGEASPEEYRLAETLKELTETVVTTVDNAKKRLNDMPHAKKKLNPLWYLMTEPLFQILAAVGLLLTGVLGLVGQLLRGLGLGGLVNGILGGLGINKLIEGIFGETGDKKGKKKGGIVSNLPIVGGLLGGK